MKNKRTGRSVPAISALTASSLLSKISSF